MTSRMSPSRAGWPTFSDSTTIRSRVLPTIPITSMPGISARTTAGAHPREVETPPNRATEDGIRPVPAGPDRSRPPQGAVSPSQSVSLTPVGGPPRFGECRRLTASKPAAPSRHPASPHESIVAQTAEAPRRPDIRPGADRCGRAALAPPGEPRLRGRGRRVHLSRPRAARARRGPRLGGAGGDGVNLVEVDQSDPAIFFEASLSNGRVTGLERTSSQAISRSVEGHRVIAAINGDVWAGFSNDMEDAPNGLHVEAGELGTARTTGRPPLGGGPDGRPILGSPLVSIMLGTTSAGQFVINRVNQLRRAGDVVLYTPHFDSRTSSAASGIDVVISGLALPLRPSGTWTGFVSTVRPAEGGWPIDPGTVVVTVPASSTLGTLLPGEPVTLSTTITPGWESIQQAVGGREWIIRDGVVSITPHPPSADEIHARSAIGLTADGRMILATVGGREVGGRAGVLLSELAELILERGAVSAINLDGGGSSSLAIRRAGTDGPVLVNRPSDGFERPVTNSIQVISSMPTGPLSVLNVQPGSRSVYRNSTIDFKVSGMDAGYNPVPLASGQVSWSLSAPIGTIDADGHFVATDPGTGQVVVTADGVTGTAPITVLADTTCPVPGSV